MDDSILRGFCKKCGVGLFYDEEYQYQFNSTVRISEACLECIPVWFLNAKQMKIVIESIEFSKFIQKKLDKEGSFTAYEDSIVGRMLEDNPFLVAKILKEEIKNE